MANRNTIYMDHCIYDHDLRISSHNLMDFTRYQKSYGLHEISEISWISCGVLTTILVHSAIHLFVCDDMLAGIDPVLQRVSERLLVEGLIT